MLSNKKHNVILVVYLFLASSTVSCQITGDYNRIEHYSEFSNLFYDLAVDSSLQEQRIEFRGSHTVIDSSFYSFVNKIPFFYPYAAFKIEKSKGTLFCVLHDCPAEMTDLRIVEFVTYDSTGILKARLMLPYEKSGWFSPNPEDFIRSTIFTSIDKILLIQSLYRKRDSHIEETRSIYGIDEDAALFDLKMSR